MIKFLFIAFLFGIVFSQTTVNIHNNGNCNGGSGCSSTPNHNKPREYIVANLNPSALPGEGFSGLFLR
jgi:hypothetical protein